VKLANLGRNALDASLAMAMLAGCGGSQPPTGAPGAMPQAFAIATQADRGTSWMLPEAKRIARHDRAGSWMSPAAKHEGLLYVSDSRAKVYVYSYPQGDLVGTLTGFDAPQGECVDSKGDVWVVEYSSNDVVEYAHGGTQPIATLTTPERSYGCSVDASSGNLAVAGSELAVYTDATGEPVTYSDSDFPEYTYCTYDGSGDLFADNVGQTLGIIAEFPSGSSQLKTITLNENLGPASMQWDGSYVAVEGSVVKYAAGGPLGPLQVYRVSVSGSTGTIVGETLLKTDVDKNKFWGVQLWISGDVIIGVDSYRRPSSPAILSWRYPKGGFPTRAIHPASGFDTVLSPAPKTSK
jgi:hypothetical protein